MCHEPIQQRREKQVCEQILSEIDSGYLVKSTVYWLSKWVHPKRKENIKSTFEKISIELFGEKIDRFDKE
jgi:hypothetical protein